MLNGEVAGVAFQNLIGAENIGFIIPTSVVRHFLDDIAQRGVCAFPTLGVLCQPLDSPSLRTFLGLDRFPEYEGAGVLVNKVLPTSSADPALQQRDVLLRFNGEMVRFSPVFSPFFPRFFPIFPPFLDRLDATARSISVAKSERRSTGW